ncbi:MAG: DUF1080 domain-containing protein [Bryobacteraceae bacterium]|jgi:hypothetical protein
MNKQTRLILLTSAAVIACAASVPLIQLLQWKPGDHNRPAPVHVTPALPGKAPSDAVSLFNGNDLLNWQDAKGQPVQWRVGDGYFEVKPNSGDIMTRQPFGDAQLHVEWLSPDPPHGTDQEPGNSGVYLMSRYEIQVLESYANTTYPDGQAGAVYCQYPPLVNPALPPGQWQTYDIVWHGPRFSAGGALEQPATVTVLWNGVLVQDHVTLTGPTDWLKRPPYKAHALKEPLLLQDHGSPVRYRNVWVRELKETLD